MLIFCSASSEPELNRALQLTGDAERGKALYPLCASCHMKTGWGKPDGSFPVIAGQHSEVLIKQMLDIRAGNRDNPTMFPFTDPQAIGGAQGIADVISYIAALPQPLAPHQGQGPGTDLASGKALYHARCQQCHGDRGQGNNASFYPKLKGQHFAYLLRHMRWIRDGYRKNSDPVMVQQLQGLDDKALSPLADYISRL